MAIAELRLNLPWAPRDVQHVSDVDVRRDSTSLLAYPDGIELEVRVLGPKAHESADALIASAKLTEGPGRVVLVAGAVPLAWRAPLREAKVSFIDVSGVVELNWPRIRISARRFAQAVRRERPPIPLQKGHARIAQELLIATSGGENPTVGDVAAGADASPAVASRAIGQLAEQGWVAKERDGKTVHVVVKDRVAIAERLSERTAWPHAETLHGYLWGRSFWDVAKKLSDTANRAHVALAVTGRAGAAFLGVLGTASPPEVRCWVGLSDRSLQETAELLGLDPAPEGEANVCLSADPWRVGVHRCHPVSSSGFTASVSHPVRVWCDLHSEPRGTEFAAQLWGMIQPGW